MDFKNPKKKICEPKVLRLLQNVISKMKTIPAFVKFKISNNFQRNIDGPNSKQLKIQRNLKKKIYEPKSLETVAKCL